MKMPIKMAFRNTLRNWRHTRATLNAIAIGVIAFALIHGYLVDAKEQFADFYIHRSMYGHLLIEADRVDEDGDPWRTQMTDQEQSAVSDLLDQESNRVKNRVSFLPIQGIIAGASNSLNVFGLAYDVKAGEDRRGDRWRWSTAAGKPLNAESQGEILVGRGLAELLGCDIQAIKPEVLKDGSYASKATQQDCFDQTRQMTALTERGQMNAYDTKISGIVDAGLRAYEDNWIMMPLSEAKTFLDTKRSSILGIELQKESDMESFAKDLRAKIQAQKLPLKVTPWYDHQIAEFYRSNIIILEIFQNFVLLIVVVVCSLALNNTITRNIMKRTKEIGTLRAIGYKQGMIVTLFSWEGFFLGMMGSIIGCLLAAGIGYLISRAGYTYVPGLISQPVPLRIAFTPKAYALSILLLSILSSIIASMISFKRSKQNIAEALIQN